MHALHLPLRIGDWEIPNRVLLAPLAGVSDPPFRRICQEMGAGLTYVEMLSSRAVVVSPVRTAALAGRHPAEPRLGVQITGANADEIGPAVAALDDGRYDTFDLNMGCPVRKIVGKGWGAALLREPDRAAAIVARARGETRRPVTVKIRLGWARHVVNVRELAAAVAEAGACMLTIHGRTREDGYGVRVDYAGIREGVQAARATAGDRLVLTGNGDVLDAASARRMALQTGCDAVMISRGALGNPWIFRGLLAATDMPPTVREWKDTVLHHLDYHQAHYQDTHRAAILFRKHLLWYLNGFPGARRMRATCSTVESIEEARQRVTTFADSLPPDQLREADRAHSLTRQPAGSPFDPKHDMDRRLDRGIAEDLHTPPA
jgi:nifR3 family TIM-barrel protein